MQEEWELLRKFIEEEREKYGPENNPRFDPVMMAVAAELGEIIEQMDFMEGKDVE